MESSKQQELSLFIHYDDGDVDVNWTLLLRRLLSGRKFIAAFVVIFTFLGILTALLQHRVYTVTVKISPESTQGAMSNQLGGLASMLGVNAGSSSNSEALGVKLFPEISQSTPFIVGLFDVIVQPNLSKEEKKQGKNEHSPISLYQYLTTSKGKISDFFHFGSNLNGNLSERLDSVNIKFLSKSQSNIVAGLQSAISVETSKGGLVEVAVTMDDPLIAMQLADSVCDRLQQCVIAYRTNKQKEDLDYYLKLEIEAKEKMIKAQTAYALSVDYDRSVILQSVSSEKERLQQEVQLTSQLYAQMAQQVEIAKAKLQEIKPVFTVVEPAIFPQYPSGTSRKLIVLAFMFVGFFISAFWKLIGEELYRYVKTEFTFQSKPKNIENVQETNGISK